VVYNISTNICMIISAVGVVDYWGKLLI